MRKKRQFKTYLKDLQNSDDSSYCTLKRREDCPNCVDDLEHRKYTTDDLLRDLHWLRLLDLNVAAIVAIL